MKNKKILKQTLFLLLGFVLLAIYIYDKRTDVQQSVSEQSQANYQQLNNQTNSSSTSDISIPSTTAGVPNTNNAGGLPAPKPAN